MDENPRYELTEILLSSQAESVAKHPEADRIFEIVYDELRRIAASLMRSERVDHTLQPTALVNEAYSRLVDQTRVGWQNRAHFFGIATRAMRQILVEHARRRSAVKRGGEWQQVTLDEGLGVGVASDIEVLDLDDALNKLAEMDERMARVVELRVFGGMSAEEVAHVLSVSRRTVQEDWRVARLWLGRELSEGTPS
jgi:RNA polymerase sigma factor (TIGR02999 family)